MLIHCRLEYTLLITRIRLHDNHVCTVFNYLVTALKSHRVSLTLTTLLMSQCGRHKVTFRENPLIACSVYWQAFKSGYKGTVVWNSFDLNIHFIRYSNAGVVYSKLTSSPGVINPHANNIKHVKTFRKTDHHEVMVSSMKLWTILKFDGNLVLF